MKMKGLFALMLAAAAGLALFTACDGSRDGGGDGDGSASGQTYTIAAPESEDYRVTAPASAKEGDSVSVTVTVRDEDSYLEGVTYNGKACSGEDGSYTFTMPAESVTLAV